MSLETPDWSDAITVLHSYSLSAALLVSLRLANRQPHLAFVVEELDVRDR